MRCTSCAASPAAARAPWPACCAAPSHTSTAAISTAAFGSTAVRAGKCLSGSWRGRSVWCRRTRARSCSPVVPATRSLSVSRTSACAAPRSSSDSMRRCVASVSAISPAAIRARSAVASSRSSSWPPSPRDGRACSSPTSRSPCWTRTRRRTWSDTSSSCAPRAPRWSPSSTAQRPSGTLPASAPRSCVRRTRATVPCRSSTETFRPSGSSARELGSTSADEPFSATSTCGSTAARSSASSAPTAPARPRSCAPSPGCRSTAGASRRPPRAETPRAAWAWASRTRTARSSTRPCGRRFCMGTRHPTRSATAASSICSASPRMRARRRSCSARARRSASVSPSS